MRHIRSTILLPVQVKEEEGAAIRLIETRMRGVQAIVRAEGNWDALRRNLAERDKAS